ncbi:hypothetical protein QAD02_023579 [Eretmocerus hayati]|uniref:Uncharacterized protein n=1 Tax=Eretmocerus hayati TaxID=131215 RepID=A0ACC2PWJ2_9HYME|nr:hypothetical protein QAD02_023579 [Eretmocerus hayati]
MYLGLIVLATSSFLGTVLGQLETVYQWRYIDYTWPSKAKRQEAIRTGDYNISRPLPMDFALSQDGRMFMTIVSVDGVPARLGVITNRTGVDSGPLIRPYPSWGWTDKKSCGAIHKPYRIQIDRCNRLWVLDSSHNALDQPRECHPKLLAFNLWTDTLIYNITIPENIATNAQTNLTLLTNVIVDTYGPYCEHTTVTVAQDRQRLDYINAIHVIPWNIWGEEEVWVMSNRLIRHDPRRGNRSLWNTKEINYRILKSPVRELVAGTSCEMPFVTFP